MTDFEPVEKGGGSGEVFISVSPNGMFYIPNRVYDQFFDGDQYVDVGTDRETKKIALRPTTEPDEERQSIYELSNNRGYGWRFNSLASLTEAGIGLDETVRLDPIWSESDQAVVLSFEEVA